MQCSASPLGHDGGSLDAALVAAEYGIPTGFMTMAANLTTGPATLAGNLAVGNAEVIAGTALDSIGIPRRTRLLCSCTNRLRSAHRRVHGRRTGRFPLRCGNQCVYPIFIIFLFPWVHLPPAQRNRTGRPGLKTACPPSWHALSCRICCWGWGSCMAAASGPLPR